MDGTHAFPDEEVRRLLTGDDAEIGQALTLIDQHLRNGLCAWLRRRFPGMTPDDLADTWSETLLIVLRTARARRFDGSRPVVPWLCAIAKSRAIDHTRRMTTRKEALAAAAAALRRSQTGQHWQGLSTAEQQEVRQLIRDAIELLPRQQRQVLRVFVDLYPETRHMNLLQREVARVSGQAETLAGIKRAPQEGRRKVRAALRRKGYAPGQGEQG